MSSALRVVMHKLLGLLPALLLVAGCALPVNLDNTGAACAFSEDPDLGPQPARDFVADEPAFFQVSLENCISACASDVKATCSANLEGSEIRVYANGSYTPPSGPSACIAVCAGVVATCATDPLPAGTYTMQYGGRTSELTVPSTPPPEESTCVVVDDE